MFQWVKLFRNQYLGFWILGLACLVIQEIPYMLMPLFQLETNPIMNMQESSVFLNLCEKALGSLCIFFMIFIVHKNAVLFSVTKKSEKVFFSLTVAVLLTNFIGWGLYVTGYQTMFVMMFFIVLLPPLYYVLIGSWRKNTILMVAGGVFFIAHVIHVFGNLKMK